MLAILGSRALWFVHLWLCVTGEAGTLLPISHRQLCGVYRPWDSSGTTDLNLCFPEHDLQNVPGRRGIFRRCMRMRRSLGNPLLLSWYGSALISLCTKQDLLVRFCFINSVRCLEGKSANPRFRGLTSSKNKQRGSPLQPGS